MKRPMPTPPAFGDYEAWKLYRVDDEHRAEFGAWVDAHRQKGMSWPSFERETKKGRSFFQQHHDVHLAAPALQQWIVTGRDRFASGRLIAQVLRNDLDAQKRTIAWALAQSRVIGRDVQQREVEAYLAAGAAS